MCRFTKGPCTAKAKGLARIALVGFFLAACSAFAQDLLIRSDEEAGTEIRVGSEREVRIVSDSENGTEISVNPSARPRRQVQNAPIIVSPEIHIRAK